MPVLRQWNQPFLLESCAAYLSCSYILTIKETFEFQVQIASKFEKFHLNLEETFYSEESQMLEQVTQSDSQVSVLGYGQSLTGHGPGRLAVSDLARCGAGGLNYLQKCLSASAVLCCMQLCDS